MAAVPSHAAPRAHARPRNGRDKLAMIRISVFAGLTLFAGVCLAVGFLFLSGSQQNHTLPGTMTPSFEFRATLQKLVQAVQDAEGGVRGVILSGDQAAYTGYRQRHQALAAHWTRIERLFDGHRAHGHDDATRARIAGLVRQKLAVMNGVVAARKSGGMAAALALVNTGRGLALTAEITKAIQRPIAEEVLVAQSMLAAQSAQIRSTATTGLLILWTFFAVVLAAAFLILRLLARNLAAECAKEETNARIKEYAELASDWFWESDSQCVVRSVSMGGNSPKSIDLNQFIGIRMGIDRTPGITDDDWLMVSSAVSDRQPFRQFTFKVRDRAGKDHTLTSAAKPILDAAGDFAGYIGTARDITAEIQARTAIDEEKLKLVQALEVAPGGISIVDANGIFLGSNSEARDARTRDGQYSHPGRPYTAMLDEAIARVGAEVAGDPTPPTGERLYERLRECGPPFEVRIGRRWYLVRSARLADDSLVVGSSDVTNMKAREEALTEARLLARTATGQARESEARFRDFAEASSDWFWETDAELVTTAITSGKHASLQVDTKPFLGVHTMTFKPPGMSEADFLRRNEALTQRGPYRDVRFQVTDTEQRLHTVSSGSRR